MTTSSLGSLPSTPQSGKTTSTFNGVLLLLGSGPVSRGAFVEGLSLQFFFVLKCCYEQAFVEKVFR